jgi:carbamoyl-phosphate synthase/aspartate carbamoyltransferase/dihydroorotase
MSNLIRIHGMVDPHVHARDLAWSHKATFYSETCAALAGGYWAIFDMPNTPPNTINRAAFDEKRASFAAKAVCDWGIYAGASQADNTADYPDFWRETCGLKIFNNDTTGDLLIESQPERLKHYRAWAQATRGERVIALHAEDETVADLLAIVRETGQRTHFLHISTAREIALLANAKAEGLPVTVGVCPHHLFLTQDDLPRLGAYGRMKPPLKTRHDADALWDALRAGIVDVIESDHAPHTRAEKEGEAPPYGVTGLETTLPLMLTAVQEGRVSLERVIASVSTHPRAIWGLDCPPDTYALVDLDAEYTLSDETLFTACGWSPYHGTRVVGKVRETWIRGVQVYDGERVLVQGGFGRNLFAPTSGEE